MVGFAASTDFPNTIPNFTTDTPNNSGAFVLRVGVPDTGVVINDEALLKAQVMMAKIFKNLAVDIIKLGLKAGKEAAKSQSQRAAKPFSLSLSVSQKITGRVKQASNIVASLNRRQLAVPCYPDINGFQSAATNMSACLTDVAAGFFCAAEGFQIPGLMTGSIYPNDPASQKFFNTAGMIAFSYGKNVANCYITAFSTALTSTTSAAAVDPAKRDACIDALSTKYFKDILPIQMNSSVIVCLRDFLNKVPSLLKTGLDQAAGNVFCCYDPVVQSIASGTSRPYNSPYTDECSCSGTCACGSCKELALGIKDPTPVPTPKTCGNGLCDGIDNCSNCGSDCKCLLPNNCLGGKCLPPFCGDGLCNSLNENCSTCARDCPCPYPFFCDNGFCHTD